LLVVRVQQRLAVVRNCRCLGVDERDGAPPAGRQTERAILIWAVLAGPRPGADRYPEVAGKTTLADALSRIDLPGTPFGNLLAYAQEVERRVPQRPDAFILWRALSGIYAMNAVGKVSFQIGSGMTAMGRVFATTELGIPLRNPLVDEVSKDLM